MKTLRLVQFRVNALVTYDIDIVQQSLAA